MRIDPTQGVDPDTGNLVGTVVQAVDLGAFPYDGNYHGPYNYSDMTGFVALGTTQPAGVWDFVQDSGANYTVWSSATLDGDLNGGDIIIEVRAADRATDLPAWPFRRFTGSTGTIPFGAPALKGRYLETRVTLLRNFGALQSPVLRKLSLAWGAPGSNLQILQHPRSQIVNLGGPALFTVSATPTGVSYQWFRNGAALAGATSSSLLVNNAQYVNAGNYYVRVTDGAGAVLNSADARLHVNSTPDETRPIATEHNDDFPGYPKVGQTATFEASMNISPSSGPVFYQWRKNGVPIPATWGECTTSDFETYAAEAYIIPAVAGADTGSYSVVFTNQYWKVVSAPAVIIVCDESYVAVPQVTVDPPSPITITDRTQPPTITATPTFTAICQQWYLATFQFGWVKVPIPGATGLQLDTLPNPVPCSFLEPNVRLLIEVFDAGYIPHAAMVQLQGDCEP